MNMDNEKLIKMLMMNAHRRRVVFEMAASVISAAVAYEKSEDDILAIMNILIKAEIEKRQGSKQKLVELNKSMRRLLDDLINSK